MKRAKYFFEVANHGKNLFYETISIITYVVGSIYEYFIRH